MRIQAILYFIVLLNRLRFVFIYLCACILKQYILTILQTYFTKSEICSHGQQLFRLQNCIYVGRRSPTRKCPMTGRSAARDRGHVPSQARHRAARRPPSPAPVAAVDREAVRRPSPVRGPAAVRQPAPVPALGPAAVPRPSLVRGHGHVAVRRATRSPPPNLARAHGRVVAHPRSRARDHAAGRRTIPPSLPSSPTRDRAAVHRTTRLNRPRSRAASRRRPILRTWRARAMLPSLATAPALPHVSIALLSRTGCGHHAILNQSPEECGLWASLVHNSSPTGRDFIRI